MRFSKQEYWSGLTFPSPGDLLDPEIEAVPLMSPELASRFFTTSAKWEAPNKCVCVNIYKYISIYYKFMYSYLIYK